MSQFYQKCINWNLSKNKNIEKLKQAKLNKEFSEDMEHMKPKNKLIINKEKVFSSFLTKNNTWKLKAEDTLQRVKIIRNLSANNCIKRVKK